VIRFANSAFWAWVLPGHISTLIMGMHSPPCCHCFADGCYCITVAQRWTSVEDDLWHHSGDRHGFREHQV